MNMDFATSRPLVQRSRLISGSCPSTRTFAPRFLQTPPRGDSPCASLTLHLHQVGWRTFTSKLLNMPGTRLGIYRGEPILTVLQFALVLTVAAIPVAMPTVLSVTMAVGARLLAKKQAIVSKLVAIEELAGVDVLCADKTGTLTQNKLTLGDPFCLDAITADELILAGALASQAANNDTIDLAVLGGAEGQAGAEALSGRAFHAVRSRAQADRGHGQGRGRKDIQGDQGRAAGHPGAVGERGRGEVRRRQGRRRLRRARLSRAGRRSRRRRRRMAASRRPAAVRSAARRRQSPPSRRRPRWA